MTVLPQTPGSTGVAGASDFVALEATELPMIHPRIIQYLLSLWETSGVMGQVIGVPISIGSVDARCQAAGQSSAPVTATLGASLPSAPLLHADETRWPHGGRTWWLWLVRSARATVFVPSASHGGRVIRELIGAPYHGVVTSDRYAGENWLDPE